jgi:hypothetical protein
MTKKYKKNKKNILSVHHHFKPAAVTHTTVKTTAPVSASFELIRFDRKTKIFLSLLVIAYILLSSLKIHTSNIGNWDLYWGKPESESVIAGKPRFIRMDEWMISTPAVMGQYERGLPLQNKANGGGNAPVIFGLPVKDISSVLRPSVWPYFLFDLERAFAFSWNFTIFLFLISMFLVFMLLVKNNFWLAVTGTFFIFLAPGIQWWSYTISNFMLYLNGMLIAFIYLLYSHRLIPVVVSSVVMMMSIFSFIAFLYPPFQVPLMYLYFFIALGYLLREKNFQKIREGWKLKVAVFSAAMIVLGIILFHYYTISKDSFQMMLNTVYPGRRISTGGNLISGKFFADFFGMFMTDTRLPKIWMNICEASGAIMFFPIVFYMMGLYYIKFKKTDTLLLSLSAFVILCSVYVLIGFPLSLSKLTLFFMSPDFRTLPVLAIGNCVLLICLLGSQKLIFKKENFSWIEFGILVISIFIFMKLVSSHINKATENYFTPNQVNIATVLILGSYLFIRYKDFKFTRPILYIMLLGMTVHNAQANPLTKGLSAILDNPLSRMSRDIYKKDPEAGWVWFGKVRTSNLLKASGIKLFNGVKYLPPLDDMKILDPDKKYDSVYNRYAWMSMGMHINWRDTVIFRQTYNDGYTIFMDPCSPRLKQLGVKYIVFDYLPQEPEVRCMTKLAEVSGISVYKRNDE